MFKKLTTLTCSIILLTSCVLPITVIHSPAPKSPSLSLNPNLVSLGLSNKLEIFNLSDPRSTNGWDINILDTASGKNWSQMEQDIMLTTNMLRHNPAKFADDFLLPIIKYVQSEKKVYLPGNVVMFSSEGQSALQEAYDILQATSSLSVFQPSSGIRLAALQHAQVQGPSGEIGHTSPDGSSPYDRLQKFGQCGEACGAENISYGNFPHGLWHVVSLVVDDGVSSRGHRKNILEPKYKLMGVGCGTHSKYDMMCVQNFAGSYVD